MLFESVAYAMGSAPQGAQPSGTDMIVQFIPLILMFAIFWFLLIRPQQKRAKEHKSMLLDLKKGDYVVTSGGMMGRILEIDLDSILLKCGESKLRISRSSIANVYEPAAKEVKMDKVENKKSDNQNKKSDNQKNVAPAVAPVPAVEAKEVESAVTPAPAVEAKEVESDAPVVAEDKKPEDDNAVIEDKKSESAK